MAPDPAQKSSTEISVELTRRVGTFSTHLVPHDYTMPTPRVMVVRIADVHCNLVGVQP